MEHQLNIGFLVMIRTTVVALILSAFVMACDDSTNPSSDTSPPPTSTDQNSSNTNNDPNTNPTTTPPTTPDTNSGTTTPPDIVPDGLKPVAAQSLSHLQSSDGVTLQAAGYTLDIIIPPAQTLSAPFDTDVLPDGRIVMSGNDGSLKAVALDGTITTTSYPANMNFESDNNGVMWYYNWVGGELLYHDGTSGSATVAATLPSVYTDGSIAVSPDGNSVYIGWWKIDYDTNSKLSALYRYTVANGLVKIVDGTATSLISAVEVTTNGDVFVAMSDGIYQLNSSDQLVLSHSLTNQGIRSDGLTSDAQGNLYYSCFGADMGIYKLTPTGEVTQLASITDSQLLPFGLSWDENNQLITGVRKERGELVTISLAGTVNVLNSPSGLSTPIAIEEHPSGSIFINGDEAGLLLINGDASVTRYKKSITSFQPPAADFTFTADGLAYYTYAAPGFDSKIVTITSNGTVTDITTNVNLPAGIEITPDGSIYYADYGNGAVMQLNSDGTSTAVLEGLQNPVGISIGADGYFWIGAAYDGATGNPAALNEVYNKRILKYRPGENVTEVIAFPDSEWHTITFFDVDDSGNLYLPDGSRLIHRAPDGTQTIIADGFSNIRGALVASDGDVYFVDYEKSALYRLVKTP